MNSSSQPRASQPFKSLETIFDQEMQQAEHELARPAGGLFLSGILAGIGVGFSMFLIAAVTTRLSPEAPTWVLEIAVANAYTVGFILVILARTDLFTEYTTIAILPVMDGRTSPAALARLWSLVYAGNLAGTAVMAGLAVVMAPTLDFADIGSFGDIAAKIVGHSWWIILLSGLLAGWLMGLLSWLVTAGRETISQLFLIWLVTGLIGYTHLHHAVTGSAEVLAGVFAGSSTSPRDYLHFLAWTTLGNAVGGFVFAGMVRHSALLAGVKESRGKQEPPRS
jgi:formate-nitrite transporter family protein